MHRQSPYGSLQPNPKSVRGNTSRPVSLANNSVNSNAIDLCNFASHLCRREKLAGYEFCLRHILEDKNAPYKQCNFHYRSQKRCPRAAPKLDKKDGFCSEHARKALISRQKILSSSSPQDLTQKCLQSLVQYKQDEIKSEFGNPNFQNSHSASMDQVGNKSGDTMDLEQDINPFQVSSRTAIASGLSGTTNLPTAGPSSAANPAQPQAAPRNAARDSEMESDDDCQSIENAWRGDGDSDAESVDSELENPLKHAGVYSSEEVIRIMRDKLIRLQKLYIDQFQRLRYLLKEERRAYKMALKREQEAGVLPIQSQPRDSIDEVTAYDEAKAMAHYNKPQGIESLLFAELSEKRQRMSEFNPTNIATLNSSSMSNSGLSGTGASSVNSPLPSGGGLLMPKTKCSFYVTSSTKCGEICIPLSKYCVKHILQDTNQVLFRACGVSVATRDFEDDMASVSDDGPCETPIPDLFEWSSCVYHTSFLPPTSSATAATVYDKTSKHDAAMNTETTSNGNIKNGPM